MIRVSIEKGKVIKGRLYIEEYDPFVGPGIQNHQWRYYSHLGDFVVGGEIIFGEQEELEALVACLFVKISHKLNYDLNNVIL